MVKVQEVSAQNPLESLTDVGFSVDSGELVAVIGSNNSGKHLLGQVIAGHRPVQKGSVTISHYQLQANPIRARSQLGYLANPVVLEKFLTGFEYLDLVAATYRLSPKVRLERIKELQDRLGFAADAYTSIERIATSIRQKIGLAAAIIHQPSLLILDEPLQYLDHSGQLSAWQAIKAEQKNGSAIILITDDLAL